MRQNKLVYYAGITVFAMLLIFSISRIKVWADPSQPDVSAKAAIVYNARTGEVIFEKNARERLPMASTTKIMSAMLALEQDRLDDEFVVDSEAIKAEGSSMGLLEGDIVTLRALVCGMLLPSGQNQLISNFHFPHTFGSTLGNPILTLSCNLSDTPWFYRMRQLAGKWTGVTAGFVV